MEKIPLREELIIQKCDHLFTMIFRVLVILAILSSLATKEWHHLIISVTTFGFTFLTQIINDHSHIKIIPEINLLAMIFLFAANFLGSILNFYDLFWWWDIFLHGLSGIFLGFAGIILIYLLNNTPKNKVSLSPFFILLFAFCFAIATGVIWEIHEFVSDTLFETTMQKSGLLDTMTDLIVHSAGALIPCVLSYRYLKSNKQSVLTRLTERWILKSMEAQDSAKK